MSVPVPVVKQFQYLSLWSSNFSSCLYFQGGLVPVPVVKQSQYRPYGQTISVLSIWTSNFSPCSCDQAILVPVPAIKQFQSLSLWSKVSLVPVPVVPDRKWRSCWSGWPARGRWPTCLNQAAHAPDWRHRKWVPYPAMKPGCGRCEGRLPECNENIRMARLGDCCGAWCWIKCHQAWFWRKCHKAY